MSLIKFRCSQCDRKIGVPDEVAGRQCRCPKCGASNVIPAATESTGTTMSDLSSLAALEAASPSNAQAGLRAMEQSDDPLAVRESTEHVNWLRRPLVKWGGLGGLLLVMLLTLALGNLVTTVFIGFVALATLNGYALGAGKVAAVLGGLVGAALLAVPMGRALEGVFSGMTGATGLTNRMLSIAVVSVIIVVIVSVTLQIVIARWLKQRPHLKPFDRPIGGCLGLCEGVLLGFIVMWSVLAVEPIAASGTAAAEVDPDTPPNPAAADVVKVVSLIRQSVIGRIADKTNPVDDLRILTLFEKVLVVLNDPEAREVFLQHEAIVAVRDRPSVKRSLELIAGDPEIKAIVEGEQAITASDLRKIMDSPMVLEAIDTTTIIAELRPMSDRIEQAVETASEQIVPVDEADESTEDAPIEPAAVGQ